MEQGEGRTGTEQEPIEERGTTETEAGKSAEVLDTVKSWLDTVGESLSHLVSTVAGARPWVPATDVYTTNTELVVLADLPGVTADQLRVDPTPTTLTLSGKAEEDDREEAVAYAQRGRPRGAFEIHLDLPAAIEHDRVSARLRGGVLEVRAPLAIIEKPVVTVVEEEEQ